MRSRVRCTSNIGDLFDASPAALQSALAGVARVITTVAVAPNDPECNPPRPDTTPAACHPDEIAENRAGDLLRGDCAKQRPLEGRTPCAATDAAQSGGQSVGQCNEGTPRGVRGHDTAAASTVPGDCFMCAGLPCLTPRECGL